MTRSILVLLLAACLAGTVLALDLTTLPIPTIKLDLTIKNSRKLLLRQQPKEQQQRSLQEVSIDSTIQSVAEQHLALTYASSFSPSVPPPSKVLLTVVTDESNANDTNGIYIRSSFLGGVVSFPIPPEEAPSRSELEQVTLDAFAIPGTGELFLKALLEEDQPELGGLLLIGASAANDGYYDNDNTSNNNNDEAVGVLHDDDGGSDSMNTWAVAAVAALGAMFLVIVLCTSILYCDWRKRKERRENKKRERHQAMAAAQAASNAAANSNNNGASLKTYHRNSVSKKIPIGNGDGGEFDGVEIVQYSGDQPALQIVIPASGSDETEEIEISPSTQGSNNNNVNYTNNANAAAPNNNSRGGMFNKLKSSRRNLPKVKSKAANAQLQAMDIADHEPDEFAPVPAQDHYHQHQPGGGGGAPQVEYVASPSEIAPSVTEYSVGEDTTMLYPTINRNRAVSKDNMSDFDGYSMDGMSAIDTGFSAYGGSGGGGDHGSGIKASGIKSRGNRDVMYSGDVPRDFDSVWGDDDQSKLTTDGMSVDNNNYMASNSKAHRSNNNKEAYGDLTKNLDELVEHHEQGSQAGEQSMITGMNLNDFDSESESGADGAFTLELLGKGPKHSHKGGIGGGGFGGTKKNSNSSMAPSSQDDEDSILGDMYRDETSELGLGESSGDELANGSGNGNVGEDKNVPSSGDSIDSTPSWAAPIQKALSRSADIFRSSSRDQDEATINNTTADTKESQEQRTKDKFVSSLSQSDDGSVGSNRSNSSTNSRGNNSATSSKSASSRKATTAKSTNEKALGLTNSMEEEVDEDPAAMIDNINSMLSECREILDTENTV
ncbi:hypothetical protein ACHAXR_011305 [Thalassiosira sp. AJA248-18]